MLKVLKPYRNEPQGIILRVGDTINGDEKLERYLLADAPECFEAVLPERPGRKGPDRDKAVHEAEVVAK